MSKRKTLLIVDDNKALTDAYALGLGRSLNVVDADVVAFNDPFKLIEWIKLNGMPSAVVTDDLMPGMLGRELAMELRRLGYTGIIVMLSGTADEDVLYCGVSVLLTKPARLRQVFEVLAPVFAPPSLQASA